MAKLFCSKISHNPYKEEMVTEITEKVFQIDGYSVGGRLLEGIMFDVYFDDRGVTEVKIEDRHSKRYVEDNLNTKKWYDAIRDYAEDILEEGDEVEVSKSIKNKYFKNGINVAYITNE